MTPKLAQGCDAKMRAHCTTVYTHDGPEKAVINNEKKMFKKFPCDRDKCYTSAHTQKKCIFLTSL